MTAHEINKWTSLWLSLPNFSVCNVFSFSWKSIKDTKLTYQTKYLFFHMHLFIKCSQGDQVHESFIARGLIGCLPLEGQWIESIHYYICCDVRR